MTLITILVCLALQKYFAIREKIHRFDFLERYVEGMKPLLGKMGISQGYGAVIGVLVPILIVVGLLDMLFHHVLLLYFIFNVFILLYCLNASDLKAQLSKYFTAYANNQMQIAHEEASKFLEGPAPKSKAEMSRSVTMAIFIKSQIEVFSIIFWYIILGPVGAVLYHLTSIIYQQSEKGEFGLLDCAEAAATIQNILDWVPVRLVGLTYALIGHFGPVISLWIQKFGAGIQETKSFLVETGLIALHADPNDPSHSDITESYQALGLVTRALWTWMIVLAVLTLTAWLF